ncbi:OB-fold nucleic acid binding domain-containing protein [Geothrix sp. 21YS21S-2]|uniref:OB-fold nucleic acid binding domain-containing protein n=1 Tax=Geothrix sp. 21YS21S-2 TaxID=3068893 RepID=UPI0027BB0E53|nr:OB-fold nucleic acid binding domain-containing protein [Geothrix sp. 21YS21S-2]
MRIIPTLLTSGALVLAGLGCSKSKPGAPTASVPAAKGVLQGTVLETVPAPPYTYLRLKAAQGEVWAAVPAADVKVGAPVTVNISITMDKFESPSLHRTFERVFMGTLAGAESAAPVGMGMGMPPKAPAAPAGPDEKVAKAAGADARTVAEVWAQKAGLKEKTVTVKGKVVKYNEAIMGRNWLHLRDGSGSDAAKDNDIAVTTQDGSRVGEVVTVKGVVRIGKDFGSGYTYPVIIEDAKIVR